MSKFYSAPCIMKDNSTTSSARHENEFCSLKVHSFAFRKLFASVPNIYPCLFSREMRIFFLLLGQKIENHRLTKGYKCFYKVVMIWWDHVSLHGQTYYLWNENKSLFCTTVINWEQVFQKEFVSGLLCNLGNWFPCLKFFLFISRRILPSLLQRANDRNVCFETLYNGQYIQYQLYW